MLTTIIIFKYFSSNQAIYQDNWFIFDSTRHESAKFF